MRYYDTLAELDRDGFNVIVDKTWEDLSPRDSFDESCCDVEQIIKDIDRGHLEWFMLRVRVMHEDLELAADYLGGMLYEDPSECLTDGSAEDLISSAIDAAKKRIPTLVEGLSKLSVDNIAV
jgi:hypothetical protein